jgi:hypothetical protein
MNGASYIFFGLILLPLVIFLGWLIKKDRKRNYIGILVLIGMAVIAVIAIVKFDSKFMNKVQNNAPKIERSPSYR